MTSLQPNYPDMNQVHPHILVMEDEEIVAKGLEMVLTEEGYDVDLAYTGEGALETFSHKDFDLLVADLRLPDIDGLEVIRIVKEQRPETEVVVITGYSSVTSAVNAMKIGVADYLPKPFTENEIKVAITNALNKSKAVEAGKDQTPVEAGEEMVIQKQEVTRVLNRTVEDTNFWRDMMEGVSDVLKEYHLSSEAKAAILSGDLGWINKNVGELTRKQLAFIFARLEREAW